MTSPTAPGVIRKWTRLQDYSDEVSVARIYAGFHYRFSTMSGRTWAKNGELAVQPRCAVQRAQLHSPVNFMSALGQKQTCALQKDGALVNVRFVPIAIRSPRRR